MSGRKLKATFSKTGDMRYISHLDLVRLFQRASRRAELPVAITQGFSPRLKISVMRALKLGKESTSEEALFYMSEDMDPNNFKESINEKLPQGVKITKVEES